MELEMICIHRPPPRGVYKLTITPGDPSEQIMDINMFHTGVGHVHDGCMISLTNWG